MTSATSATSATSVTSVSSATTDWIVQPDGSDRPSASPWRAALRRLARDRSAMVGAAVLVLLAVLAVLATQIAPYECRTQLNIIDLKNVPPSLAHPFGTDVYSRDVLSRIICGARVSLTIAVLSVLMAATVGTAYGAISGYVGGWLDALMMRVVDALLAIPRVLGLIGWFGVSRLVRTLVLSAREDEFVTAARALGASNARILAHHILPQVISPVLVAATLAVGNVIVIEAGLSYIGIGIRPPDPSWGSIFTDGASSYSSAWWVWLSSGVALVVTVLAVNLVVDGMRRALSGRASVVR